MQVRQLVSCLLCRVLSEERICKGQLEATIIKKQQHNVPRQMRLKVFLKIPNGVCLQESETSRKLATAVKTYLPRIINFLRRQLIKSGVRPTYSAAIIFPLSAVSAFPTHCISQQGTSRRSVYSKSPHTKHKQLVRFQWPFVPCSASSFGLSEA